MSIDALPAAPSPTDSAAAFDANAFAFLAALQAFRTQTNATAVDMQTNADITAALALGMALPNYAGTSTTSLVVGTGARSFTTQTGKSWVPGQVVVATNGANLMKGTVTAYSGATLDVNVTTISGSGTFASWTIGLSYAGLVLAASGANSDITSLLGLTTPLSKAQGGSGYATGGADKIQPITASVAANALTLTLNPTTLDFRSATLGSGTVNTRSIPAAISLVISNGSTLGATSAQLTRVVVLAIDNAGTIELAAVNVSGGNDLTETGLITTVAEGGAGAADSASVVYSATARTSVPYRVVGYVEFTQATAGVYATAPSTVQGMGGQALAVMASLGHSQKWTDLIGSRGNGTTYYNTTGRPIEVRMYSTFNLSSASAWNLTVDGKIVCYSNVGQSGAGAGGRGWCGAVVPPGNSYVYSGSGLEGWAELR